MSVFYDTFLSNQCGISFVKYRSNKDLFASENVMSVETCDSLVSKGFQSTIGGEAIKK